MQYHRYVGSSKLPAPAKGAWEGWDAVRGRDFRDTPVGGGYLDSERG